MKRLFAVRSIKNNLYPSNKKPDYFSDKMQAKELRDSLNEPGITPQFFITYGPDHRKYNKRAV